MRNLWSLLNLFLKILNIWFFILSSRFPILNMAVLFFLMKWITKDQPHYLFVRELGGVKTWGYFLFMLFFEFPFFWSFFCLWGDVKMLSRNTNQPNLDSAIKFRDGQMNITTPQKAFEIYRETSSLDMMKAKEGNPTFERAIQGYKAVYGNKPPNEVYKDLTEND